jgi:hypothetical protein
MENSPKVAADHGLIACYHGMAFESHAVKTTV